MLRRQERFEEWLGEELREYATAAVMAGDEELLDRVVEIALNRPVPKHDDVDRAGNG